MCGRYVLRVILKNLQRDFDLGFEVEESDLPLEQRARYNIAPTQLVSVIRVVDGARRHSLLRWGLIPRWVAGDRDRRPQINARGETVFEKPMFRDSARHRRCLMLADGYYEWRRDEKDRPLQAFFVERRDSKPFAMAAIWDMWISSDGEVIESVAVLTTHANADLDGIHDRMPVILDKRDYLTWLHAERVPVEDAQALIKPPPAGLLIARAIGNRVNAVKNDDAGNLDPPDPNEPPKPPKGSDPRQGDLF